MVSTVVFVSLLLCGVGQGSYLKHSQWRDKLHPQNNEREAEPIREPDSLSQVREYTTTTTTMNDMTTTPTATTMEPKVTTPKKKPGKIPFRPLKEPSKLASRSKGLPATATARPRFLNMVHDFVYPQIEVFSHRDGSPYIFTGPDRIMDTRPFSRRINTQQPSERKASCGGDFEALSGIIASPDYPFNYPNNIKCIYRITVPDGLTVGLDCNDFSIQPGDLDCENDFLAIYRSGNTETEDANRYCGDKAISVESDGNNMTLIFKSNIDFRYRGFMCRYRALNPDGTGAEGMVISNTTAEEHTIICTGPGDGGWAGKCGVSFAPGSRIVGGGKVDKHQFPWMASIVKECGVAMDHYCHICGGTVIHEKWILTGAHCLVSVPVEQLGVLLGDHNLYTLTPSQKFFRIGSVYIHPDFNIPSPLNNDVALIEFPQEISFSRHIAPVCMPPRNALDLLNVIPRLVEDDTPIRQAPPLSHITLRENLVGRNVSVYGWGTVNDDGERAEVLRTVSVKVLTNDDCDYYYGVMTDTMMCTSGDGGHGPCLGDSGSPAQLQMVDGRWVQIGVLAFGAAYGCEVGYPSGNVLLPVFVDWIEFITGVDFSEYN